MLNDEVLRLLPAVLAEVQSTDAELALGVLAERTRA